MLYTNARIENALKTQDIRVENGLITAIEDKLSPLPAEAVEDLGGKLVLPPFVEPHVHLDTTLTAGDPVWNMSGTLFEGIECWAKRKEKLSAADVKERVRRAVRLYAANGVQFIRTHVDVTDPSLVALKAILEVREELRGLADIQVVAFPQEGILSFPNGKGLMEEAVKLGADAVGAIPHFEFTREYAVESLNYACELAARHGLLMDVHCDETDDDQSRGLETLATRALELGLKDRVTASHTCAMHSYNNAYVLKLMRLLKMSEINFVANPLVNTHLHIPQAPGRDPGQGADRRRYQRGLRQRRSLRPLVSHGLRHHAGHGVSGPARDPDDGPGGHSEQLSLRDGQRRSGPAPGRQLWLEGGQPRQLRGHGRRRLL